MRNKLLKNQYNLKFQTMKENNKLKVILYNQKTQNQPKLTKQDQQEILLNLSSLMERIQHKMSNKRRKITTLKMITLKMITLKMGNKINKTMINNNHLKGRIINLIHIDIVEIINFPDIYFQIIEVI